MYTTEQRRKGKLQKSEMCIMQQAYKNLYKHRWQFTVIITYKIGILMDIELVHITRQHNTLLSP